MEYGEFVHRAHMDIRRGEGKCQIACGGFSARIIAVEHSAAHQGADSIGDLLGLSHKLWTKNKYVYPLTIGATGCISVVYALDTAKVPLGVFGELLRKLPLYSMGFCWVSIAAAALLISIGLHYLVKKSS